MLHIRSAFAIIISAILIFGCSSAQPSQDSSAISTQAVETALTSLNENSPQTSTHTISYYWHKYNNEDNPFNNVSINNQNAHQVIQIAGWGKGIVHDTTVSPDGILIVTASSTGAYLYNINTKEDELLTAPDTNVSSVQFSPDGKLLAINAGRKIELLNTTNWEVTRIIEHTIAIKNVTFSPDGSMIAAAGFDATIWRISTGEEVFHVKNANSSSKINCIVFFPDGQNVAIGTDDYGIVLYTILTNSPYKPLDNNISGAESLAISPDGQMLVAGGSNVRIWDILNGTTTGMGLEYGQIVAFSPNGKYLVTSEKNKVLIWDTTKGMYEFELIQTLETNNPASSYEFSQNNKTLVVGTPGEVKVWQIPDGKLIDSINGYTGEIYDIDISSDEQFLAIASEDNKVLIVKISNGTIFQTLTGITDGVRKAVFSPDGKNLAATDFDGNIILWEVASGQIIKQIKLGKTGDLTSELSFSNNKYLVSHALYEPLMVWNIPEGTLAATIENVRIGRDYIASSFNGQLIAIPYDDYNLTIWSLPDGVQISNFGKMYENRFDSIAFSQDGNYIAVGGDDEDNTPEITIINILDGATVKVINDPEIFSDNYNKLMFSSDENLLIAASEGKLITIWNMQNGSVINRLTGHNSSIENIGFSANESLIVSGSQDGTVRFWGIPSSQANLAPSTDAEGLSVETITPTLEQPFPAQSNSNTFASCLNFTSQLQPNMEAKVITDAINMREKPGTNQPVVEIIYNNDKVQITSEPPICGDGYLWWKVQALKSGAIGWVVEGIEGERWLSP